MNLRDAEFLGQGRNRAAYRRGRWVYKVPATDYGYSDNASEAWTFKKTAGRDGDFRFARCRLLPNGWLVMEYVEPVSSLKGLPHWTDFIDCQQVGYNQHGELVAYDYA